MECSCFSCQRSTFCQLLAGSALGFGIICQFIATTYVPQVIFNPDIDEFVSKPITWNEAQVIGMLLGLSTGVSVLVAIGFYVVGGIAYQREKAKKIREAEERGREASGYWNEETN